MAFQSNAFQNDAFQIINNIVLANPVGITWSLFSPTLVFGNITDSPTLLNLVWGIASPTAIASGNLIALPDPVDLLWNIPDPQAILSNFGATHIIYSTTVNGGTVVGTDSIELDILLILSGEATAETDLNFYCYYGGVLGATLNVNIHDGAVALSLDSPIWLNCKVIANNNSNSQSIVFSKYSNEAGVDEVVSSNNSTMNIDSNTNQLFKVEMITNGDYTNSQVTKEYAILRQYVPI